MKSNSTIIIAEAGVNHNGKLSMAKKLVDAAAAAKVDYVKFQTFNAKKLVSPIARKAEYQNLDAANESQLELLEKLELKAGEFKELLAYCQTKNVGFLSTGFDTESLDFLNELSLPLFKIPSGELTNLPYLRQIASFNKPIVLSTGMATLEEVKSSVRELYKNGLKKENLTVLHCNTDYPTNMEDVNLKAMLHIQEELGVNVGYSDHTLGIEIPIAAVALGATVIEKHFTLDRSLDGPDHKASLLPEELKEMTLSIRNVETALKGSGKKTPTTGELKNSLVARKSIHTSRNLKASDVISSSDLIMLRPGDGISPMEVDQLIGKKVIRDILAGEKLSKSDIT